MAGISRYEKIVLILTVAFLLFVSGWFLARSTAPTSYVVTVTSSGEEQQVTQPPAVEAMARPDSLLPGEMIDINTADLHDLMRLPGIGEKRAQKILDYRAEHGPFQSVDELVAVKGIGEGILGGLRDYVTAGQTQGD